MRFLCLQLTSIIVASMGIFSYAFAGTPLIVSHQGRLLAADDSPISGPTDIEFRIYEVPLGGAPLWTEMHLDVPVDDGLFSVTLGATSPLSPDLLSQSSILPLERYLEVVVEGTVISPRMRLASVPYAVASNRVSGDIETTPGGIDASEPVTGLHVSTTTSDPESQLSITQNGVKRFGIGVQQPSSPLGVRMVIGDGGLNGSYDTDVSNDESRIRLIDSTSSGHAVITSSVHGDLGLQPLGGEILVHGDDGLSSASVSAKVDRAGGTMTGDLAVIAGPSSAALSATLIGSSLHMMDDRNLLGLREFDASVGPDTSRLKLSSDSDGDGIASKNIGLYVSDVSGQSKIECSSDNDDDGIPDQEIVSKITPTIVQHAINTKGTGGNNGRVGITSSTSLDSAIVECSSDADGDGNPELMSNKRMINADAKLKAVMRVDLDDDGTPDSEVSSECDATSAKHAINTKGTGANNGHTKVVSRTFEGGADVDVSSDSDGDGHDEAKVYVIATPFDGVGSGETSVGMAIDSDDDGDADNSIVESCDILSAKIVMDRDSGRSKGFMRVAPEGPSISLEHEFAPVFGVSTILDSTFLELSSASGISKLKGQVGDLKGDISLTNSSGGKLQAQLNEQKSQISMSSSSGSESMDMEVDNSAGPGAQPSSSFRLGRPAINEGIFLSDATSMSMTLLHDDGPAGSSSAKLFSDLIDSYLNLEDDGLTSFRASSASGMELRSTSNVVTSTIDRNGNAYMANTLAIGAASSGHHIDVAGGAYCDGTNWVNASDKNAKENFEQIDGEELLVKIADLDITRWNYKGDDAAKHIGPTAQDFKKTFGVGADDKSISTIDPSGIALAAIKELYAQLKQKDIQLSTQSKQIEELQEQLSQLAKELKKK